MWWPSKLSVKRDVPSPKPGQDALVGPTSPVW
jgi:hypothetical protein